MFLGTIVMGLLLTVVVFFGFGLYHANKSGELGKMPTVKDAWRRSMTPEGIAEVEAEKAAKGKE